MKECETYGQLSVPPHDQASESLPTSSITTKECEAYGQLSAPQACESLPTSGITMKECEAYGQLSVPPRASESQTNAEYELVSST